MLTAFSHVFRMTFLNKSIILFNLPSPGEDQKYTLNQ